MITPRSAAKRRILEELDLNKNQQIPLNVKMISEKAYDKSFDMREKFKNLQDPLGFIHNENLQNLVRNTKQTAKKMKIQMQETCQLSKTMYKNMIATQEENTFINESFHQKVSLMSKIQIDQKDIITKQKKLKQFKVLSDPMIMLVRQLKARQISLKTKESLGPQYYRHQRQQILPSQTQNTTNDLTYKQIKMIGTPEFNMKCHNVEFYDLLSGKDNKKIPTINQSSFNINKNYYIDLFAQKIPFNLILESSQLSENSKQIYFDYERNLNFWRIDSKNGQESESKVEIEKSNNKQKMILPNFLNFKKTQLNQNNLYDFAMCKFTPNQIKQYFNLKKQHYEKQEACKNDQNLEQRYEQLKNQLDRMQQLKNRTIAQRIPVRFKETQCQTIEILEQKQFDNYFFESLNTLLRNMDKLNKVRQNGLIDPKNTKKLIIAKNTCFQIQEILFKMLTYVLKGEKFYPRYVENEKHYVPYFTYNQLFDTQNREHVENNILALIHDKIDQFEQDIVDGVKKADLIKIYIEQRQRNNRILEMIDFMN